MVKKASIIRIYKEQELQLVLYVGNNFEQYTNTKAESLFTVQKNVGAKERRKIGNALYVERSFKHPQKGIKSIVLTNAEI